MRLLLLSHSEKSTLTHPCRPLRLGLTPSSLSIIPVAMKSSIIPRRQTVKQTTIAMIATTPPFPRETRAIQLLLVSATVAVLFRHYGTLNMLVYYLCKLQYWTTNVQLGPGRSDSSPKLPELKSIWQDFSKSNNPSQTRRTTVHCHP
jgi:hypothetical protein